MKKYILSILIFVICLVGLVSCKTVTPTTPTETPITTPTEEQVNGYNIVFYTFNKTTDPTTIKNVTNIPNELPTLTVEGYIFDGWYYDMDFTVLVTPGDKIEENTTLYAKLTIVIDEETKTEEITPTIPEDEETDLPTVDVPTQDTDEPTIDIPTEDVDTPTVDAPTQDTNEPTVDEPTQEVTPEPSVSYYKVTWKNYDGEELEIDLEVLENSIPTYNGITPTKPGTSTTYYTFKGWTPEITPVTEDVVYTATFRENEINTSDVEGTVPVVSADGKTIKYGLYPQTHVNDTTLINTLNNLSASLNGWYYYEGSYYHKETAKLYNNESYTFDDGTSIVNGTVYWFKCEPITWNIMSNENGNYYLVSSKLLDVQSFYKNYNNRVQNDTIIYSNNYEKSDLRTWLNNIFYNTAFSLNNTYVTTTNVDNSANTTDSSTNKYYSNNTLDKVLLPTYQDYLNQNLGFDTTNTISKTRECKTTDYARAKGAYVNKDSGRLNNGTYWTRSACSEFYYCTWTVNTGGYLSAYAVDGNTHCVRPSIYIQFQ